IRRAAAAPGPAVLAGQPLAGRGGAAHAAEGVADALHALVVIGCRRAARLDADGATVRFDLLRDLREVDADVVVLGADIGDAQVLVLGQQIAVPGQHRDAGRLGRGERAGHRRGVRGRDGDAVDAGRDQVVDHLQLLLAAAGLAGADVAGFDG